MTRRDPYSWTVARLPERDLAEVVLEFAAPLLERLGPAPAVDNARAAFALAVSFWNASVLASKRWEYPRVKELNALKKRMRGRAAAREDAATFDLLAERWREHWLDPRLVENWTYEPDGAGVHRPAGAPGRVLQGRALCHWRRPGGAHAGGRHPRGSTYRLTSFPP